MKLTVIVGVVVALLGLCLWFLAALRTASLATAECTKDVVAANVLIDVISLYVEAEAVMPGDLADLTEIHYTSGRTAWPRDKTQILERVTIEFHEGLMAPSCISYSGRCQFDLENARLSSLWLSCAAEPVRAAGD